MRGNMITHWALYHLGIHTARTQLSRPETEQLIQLAGTAESIVELGVFEGATSLHLRKSMRPSGTLYGIDPFFSGFVGFSYGLSIATREVNKSNNGKVQFIQKMSYEASAGWAKPIDLLFVDADHAYEAVKQDWLEWSPFIRRGGHIALHDSCVYAGRCGPTVGPVLLVNELKKVPGRFKLVRQVDTLSVFQRNY